MSIKDYVLIRPILTEKMSFMEERENKYAFQIHVKANKLEIKKAVEDKFNVVVEKVNVMQVKGKIKEMSIRSGGRVIRTRGRRANWKKAIITLKEGEKIDYLGTSST